MPTNFEFIEINDANATARKIAGDFETQGADDIFHQTSRILGTRLEEGINVTLQDTPATIIALNGMETHVLVDVGSQITDPLEIGLRYFTGGPLYPADWVTMIPHEMRGGYQAFEWGAAPFNGWKESDDESSTNNTGGRMFLIPTNGAVEISISLYGTGVSITGVNWARLVLPNDPVQKTITKTTRLVSDGGLATQLPTAEADYPVNEWVGGSVGLRHRESTAGGPGPDAAIMLKSLTVGPIGFGSPTQFGDIDVVIFNTDPAFTDGQAVAATQIVPYRTIAVLRFRQTPGQGDYPLTDFGGDLIGSITDLNLLLPGDVNPQNENAAWLAIRTVTAINAPEVGANGIGVGYVIDWG